ncbi:GDSL-type esterase/lipase family protein [Aquisphaera insulae]|uniref:GDSL-type esterase/lipase family protein n=1 Tax=Aquisphaera insulae TaxID=2712864 RepID=UPI0013EA1BE7|nr:GDSL-type esterase/lipase family protein [Aquisphaera insulae]
MFRTSLLRSLFLLAAGPLSWPLSAPAQAPPAAESSAREAAPKPVVFTTQQDHENMLRQLGITRLRPGRNGNEKATQNPANYDEARANPYPDLPDVLTAAGGAKVATPEQWWKTRRPELVELLEREVYGRVPADVPGVKWEVRETREITAGGKPAIQKHIVGVVDNSACPEIAVNISMSLTLPKDAAGRLPVLMSFGWTPFEPSPFAFMGRGPGGGNGPRPPSKEDKLIAAGWGSAILNPTTVQDDSGGWQRNPFDRNAKPDAKPTGAGLTRGIIGLTNHGQPRKPDDWGALRAWAWGASRALDYLETEPHVDASRVGIAGVSRYGKAALVGMAFDPRFAAGLIASSGAGGTKLYRRNFGESLENLAGSGAYHWMAGNYIKYSAEESSFGRKTAADLPVDSHMTLALCAPRLVFISHGIPERGDARWLDHQGSFMAAIAAQPAFRLLGAHGLGRSDDDRTETMPGVKVDLLDGELAWRQHDGGHTDEPNIESFIAWSNRHFPRVNESGTPGGRPAGPPHAAIPRTDPNSIAAHEQLLRKAKQGRIDVYFVGDSITRRWGATDYPEFLSLWKTQFHGRNAANFGWGGDTTHNILWRLQNGELDGVSPRVIVVQAGTNNLPRNGPADAARVDEIVGGIRAILDACRRRAPEAAIVFTGIFPRSQNPALAPAIRQINDRLAGLDDDKHLRFLNINDRLAGADGILLPGMSPDGLHLSARGYEAWGSALNPILTELIGPPAAEDHAPPPTGDPAARTSAPAPAQDAAPRPASTTPSPAGVEVPAILKIKRPTAEEVATAEKALADFKASADPRTREILKAYPALLEVRVPPPNSAIVPNLAPFFRQKHEANNAVAKEGKAELLFMGDSITDFWRNERGPFAGKAVFEKRFGKWKVANFGISGDTTQGVLYRLQDGEGAGISPRAVMLMIGTNNTGRNSAAEIAEGIGAVVLKLRKCFPDAQILLLGVFPRGRSANDPIRQTIRDINAAISKLDDHDKIHYLDIGPRFLDAAGNIPQDVMTDALHPTTKGYEIWAEAVMPTLEKLMNHGGN